MTSDLINEQGVNAGGLTALSVVIPVFNEEVWLRTAVDALCDAAETADVRLDVVIVDDGSTDGTPAVLDDLAKRPQIRVLRQANSGRLAARSAGLAVASETWVLLLDSRVIIERDSLRWLRAQLSDHHDRRVWCGHVDVETRNNVFAAFWAGLVKVGWRRYTANPRLVSFGADEFDFYPKGTGCLLMERSELLRSIDGFTSMYDVASLSSDDTRLLRDVASRQKIWLSPEFCFRYHGKTGARGFVRQAYFRGTTFVDGYLGHPGVVRRALISAIGAAAVFGAISVRHPRVGAAGIATALVALPSTVKLVGGSPYEVRATALLTPAFLPLFGAGVIRGLILAGLQILRSSVPARRK